MKNNSNVKKSIILSGLVGTGGLFIAKLIGIVYAIPFSSILGNEAYMSIYGQAYNIYSYVLMVFTAGFPFAIATLVARYSVLKDAKSILSVKKIALLFLSITGFLGMMLLMLLAGKIAPVMVEENIDVMTNTIRLLAIAVFLVPILSAYRGLYQGLKEMEEYAFSQAFEQVFRVGFLLIGSCIVVYALGLDRKYALYISVLSTSVAAIAGIAQIYRFDQKKKGEVEQVAAEQISDGVDRKTLFKEFFTLSIPYLFTSILGYSQQIYNAILLPIGLRLHDYASKTITTIISATTYVGVKITAIPMILAPGFTAAIIPHITEALTKKDYKLIRKDIIDCVNIILYIGIPVCFCIFLYSKPINYTLFYNEDLNMAAYVLAWLSLEAFLGTLAPVVTNMMMALELRKNYLKRLVFSTVMKGITIIPLIALFGFAGSVISSVIWDGYLIVFNLREIKKVYKVKFKKAFWVLSRVLICVVMMGLVSMFLNWIGIGGVDCGRITSFIYMCINGLVSVATFVGLSIVLHLPNVVFHVDVKELINKLLRKA
ncbi:MAG: oligosaccharide flippase family protein [Erysipelotrichaceae bacterium]|uniref:oligosaccharide flippase family protein n=1 Tax=Floccifex sp. TaxID=2815810 RepID=UPI002A74782B|nr:oligosaccharide flippase family protein [Floccifex sp.]MDD7281834.1 oligosaccharide flippase family protein [Erysipelotrichaceae bacterium]MDY2958519.1 oligosaccharide flippase family protein [Floccifex sp.]